MKPVLDDYIRMDPERKPLVDHYARMKFKMGSTVLYNGKQTTITGWSTNGDLGEESTYCYQLNIGGDLIQETELLSSAEGSS